MIITTHDFNNLRHKDDGVVYFHPVSKLVSFVIYYEDSDYLGIMPMMKRDKITCDIEEIKLMSSDNEYFSPIRPIRVNGSEYQVVPEAHQSLSDIKVQREIEKEEYREQKDKAKANSPLDLLEV